MMLKMVRKYIEKIRLCPNQKKNETKFTHFFAFFFHFFFFALKSDKQIFGLKSYPKMVKKNFFLNQKMLPKWSKISAVKID